MSSTAGSSAQEAFYDASEELPGKSTRSAKAAAYGYDEESLLPLLSPIQGTPMHAGAAAEPPGGAQLPRSLRVADLNRQLRAGFIRKVFALLCAALTFTTAVCFAFRAAESLRVYVVYNPWTFWLAFLVSLTTVLVLSASEAARRRHPQNLVWLGVFIVAQSFMVGTATCLFDTNVLLLAFGITTVVTLALTLFALQTRYDLTSAYGIMFPLLVAALVAAVVNVFVRARPFDLIVSGAIALLFAVYIIVDVQMLVGGKHMYAVSPDEYVFATLSLYLDIINLFLYTLRFLNSASDR